MFALQQKRVAIAGLGASGVAAARLCLARGARVIAYDESLDAPSPAAQELLAQGVELIRGPLVEGALGQVDLVVVSPGLPARPAFAAAAAAGIEVIGELELGGRFSTAPMALVGGTNGKSTVTAWVGAMLEAAGQTVFLGGNFGAPLCAHVDQRFDALVIEISSFQAERVPTLHPRVHALLNITDDHLDRYPSFAAYANAKGNPFVNMAADDVAVLPVGDDRCAAQAARGSSRRVTFGGDAPRADVAIEGEHIVDRPRRDRYPIGSIRLRGEHNLINACAAIAVAREMGGSPEAIVEGLSRFDGLAHRNVLVAQQHGVSYYDDSKATNVGAAVAALRGLGGAKAVLIAGGRDKHGDLAPLVSVLRDKGRALVLLGEAAERMAEAARGALPIVRVATMAEAVRAATELAKEGDAVLLSPACSSYDMYGSFAKRGDDFAAAVRQQLGEGG